MDALLIENVRCFKGRVRAPLAGLTLLVGENSTGKSTFLAMARLAWDLGAGQGLPEFNEAPFRFGTYDQIAHFHGGKAKRATSFGVGFTVDVQRATLTLGQKTRWGRPLASLEGDILFKASFISVRGQPRLSAWQLSAGKYELTYSLALSDRTPVIQFSTPQGQASFGATFGRRFLATASWGLGHLTDLVDLLRLGVTKEPGKLDSVVEGTPPTEADFEFLTALAVLLRRRLGKGRPHALAPIRSEPERTYEPGDDRPSATGGHVPSAVAHLLASDRPVDSEARSYLTSFGQKSGLFESIDVRRLGSQTEADPFQIQVHVREQYRDSNLVDVGYGVSQALPILVDSIRSQLGSFLLQQPEVHLHPRAQAELGTFFAAQSKEGRSFIIETHSDYLVDRVCMEIREGTISPEMVQLLFFEHHAAGVKISPIRIDRQGVLVDPPPTYRSFFLGEQRRYLGA